jgi:hypothetical protein
MMSRSSPSDIAGNLPSSWMLAVNAEKILGTSNYKLTYIKSSHNITDGMLTIPNLPWFYTQRLPPVGWPCSHTSWWSMWPEIPYFEDSSRALPFHHNSVPDTWGGLYWNIGSRYEDTPVAWLSENCISDSVSLPHNCSPGRPRRHAIGFLSSLNDLTLIECMLARLKSYLRCRSFFFILQHLSTLPSIFFWRSHWTPDWLPAWNALDCFDEAHIHRRNMREDILTFSRWKKFSLA